MGEERIMGVEALCFKWLFGWVSVYVALLVLS